MKKALSSLILPFCAAAASAQNRFPKPDFESGYQYPQFRYPVPDETLWEVVDLTLLVVLMSIVAWSVIRAGKRAPVLLVSIFSVGYFGFFRTGCVCSIGAVQNVALALADASYAIPLTVALFFLLPIVFSLLFGRVFCGGVCPLGALQELVNIRSIRLPRALSLSLGLLPWIYLVFAVWFAATRTGFIICRFDPFIGVFRLGGDAGMIIFGALLLVASIFTGRPFCRFLCPYGAILSLFSRVSIRKMSLTPSCINCELCHHACPVDAIRPPFANRVKESRVEGVRRILAYLVFLPAMALAGAFLLSMTSDSFGSLHRDMRLYAMAQQQEEHPQNILPLDLEVYYGQGGTLEEITLRSEQLRTDFRRYAAASGALIGLAAGLMLISLSLKRTRPTYEIDDAACVNCGRCFSYCPQNRIHIVKPGNITP
jgi:polyferredoxin